MRCATISLGSLSLWTGTPAEQTGARAGEPGRAGAAPLYPVRPLLRRWRAFPTRKRLLVHCTLVVPRYRRKAVVCPRGDSTAYAILKRRSVELACGAPGGGPGPPGGRGSDLRFSRWAWFRRPANVQLFLPCPMGSAEKLLVRRRGDALEQPAPQRGRIGAAPERLACTLGHVDPPRLKERQNRLP